MLEKLKRKKRYHYSRKDNLDLFDKIAKETRRRLLYGEYLLSKEKWDKAKIRYIKKYKVITIDDMSDQELLKLVMLETKRKLKYKKNRENLLNKCKKHVFKCLSQGYSGKGTKISPFEIWKILKKQRCVCPLTGRKITKENISLDHIIPRSRGGSNNLSNLRFVDYDANIAKSTLLDEEFLKLCKDIVNHNQSN